MAVTFQKTTLATLPDGTIVETKDFGSEGHRQVVEPRGVEPIADASASITDTSAQLLAADADRNVAEFINASDSITIALSPFDGVAALNSAGSVTLLPFGSYVARGALAASKWNAIAASGTPPVTVFVG